MTPEGVDDEIVLDKPFRLIPIWKRLLVVLAGSAFYFICSWSTLFFTETIFGEPINQVFVQGLAVANPVAAQAGVQIHDRIISVDKQPITESSEIIAYLTAHPQTEVTLRVQRQDEQLDLTVKPNQTGRVGMILDTVPTKVYRPVSLKESMFITGQKFGSLNGAVVGGIGAVGRSLYATAGNEKSPKKAHGFFALSSFANAIAKQDLRQLPVYFSLISLNMGLLGVVPWPGTDGSHLLGMLISTGRGKAVRPSGPTLFGYIALLILYIGNGLPACMLRSNSKNKD